MTPVPPCAVKYIRYFLRLHEFNEEDIFNYIVLHNIEYRSTLEEDENRIRDALVMREDYINSAPYDMDIDELTDDDILYLRGMSVSVFEIMMCLARRIEEIFEDNNKGDRTKEWFYMFLKNLDIDDIMSQKYGFDRERFIKLAVDKWLDREYEANGENGNIFVISNELCKKRTLDLRHIQTWDQMQLWASEQTMLEEAEDKVLD